MTVFLTSIYFHKISTKIRVVDLKTIRHFFLKRMTDNRILNDLGFTDGLKATGFLLISGILKGQLVLKRLFPYCVRGLFKPGSSLLGLKAE